jgi:hypothetical protein
MDFLLRLIPGSLLSWINAMLAVVWCETNNGYDYLWRVLKLTVPGFDPVIAIQTPQWAACKDIFQFSQAYLLYFHLQGKMHYHYMDCTKSGIFLWVIQHLDYADMVTTLQLHDNSYCKDSHPISASTALPRAFTRMHKHGLGYRLSANLTH